MFAVRNTVQIDAPIVRNATRCGFFMAGFGLSVWAPLVPYVRERIEMTDAVFGLLLLCIGIGSLTWMPISGLLVARWGIRPVQLCSVALLALALAGMALTDSIGWLGLALFCFGGSLGVIDVIMNIQAVLVETAVGRRLMSNFHGMYSLGAISGALVLTGLLSLGLAPEVGSFMMIGVIVAANLALARGYLPNRAPGGGLAFVRPTGLVMLVGLMCFVVYLAEGAVLDWSALYLTGEKGLEVARGGLGYAAFALMVTIARFAGAPLVNSLGTARVIAFGGMLAAFGIGLSLTADHWALALVGYGLCGLGCANVSPVLISSLSRQDGMPVQLAVTVATTIGFAGVLAGPAMMGMVAHFSSLGMAFALLAVLLLGIVPFCRRFAA
ncbi:MAG TPA: MFS transporter [Pseudomonas sp.]|uniref:MFS transporter n=1 Tax=Stutzerimonas frequens TaxID=2968969 RepID=UPI000C4B7332|nr:MFS transporter [Stutzerimonas frequens]MAL90607.1 MFS transporter [Pseudomonas sp.]MBA4724709.1 MFS transporter [Pseudomonas sp.]MBK3916974.1 MFS transporter [Stutzerimonas frequens]QFU12595.1 Inner membrane protein YbjJ [Stutzerimonas frequens]HAW63249.1 MFS transporter [Pseudomonas sp.]|tara:strand:- start:389 stop:1537 length:1149 start_codon:yes stop_codon:yes gene_type:complete